MKVARIAVAVALAISASTALAQLYRWTDQQGRVHITDTPPPPSAKDVKKGPGGSAPAPAGKGEPAAGNEPFALQLARKNNPVTLYTTPGCDACGEARKLLNTRGIPFKEISVNDEKQLEELKRVVGSNSVPSMIVGSAVQKGFEEGNYNRALDAAGYPKAGTLAPRNQAEPQQVERPTGDTDTTPKPTAEAAPSGPYAPGAPPQRSQRK
jgi:glutaredoxin